MELRERQHHDHSPPAPSGAPLAADRADQHAAAERLLAAAEGAIERALSNDSVAFLRANRQIGGQ